MIAYDPARPTCFDPSQLSEIPDPFPVFEQLRALGSVVALDTGFRAVTGYAAADATLRDRRFKSGPIALRFKMGLPKGAAQDELAHRINFLDPPDHPRVRSLVQKAFTPARVRAMRPWLEAKTEALLDDASARARDAKRDDIDLRQELAHALPSLVMSEMLGVPVADRDRLTEWTEAVTPLLNTAVQSDSQARALAAAESFWAYAEALIAERRRQPGDDLLTAMLLAEEAEDTLSREELLSLFVTLYSAGHRTTRDLFCNGLLTLLQQRDQFAAVVAEPSLVPAAVNEFLRHQTPTLLVARVPMEPAEIDGVPIPAFAPTLILLAAANRDPATFADPQRFDVRRQEASPLSFATGPHHCLGAALARMEAEVMLAAVCRRWPRLGLIEPPPAWWHSGPFRGLTHLRVDLGDG